MIRIVIADDHHLVRQSIVFLFEQMDDIEIVGEAADGYESLSLIQKKRPDIVIMDISMPLMNGIEATHKIQSLHVDTRVIILSMHSDEDVVLQALKNGAKGYLLKSSVVEELIIAIRSVNRGEMYLSPSITQSILSDFLHSDPADKPMTVLDRLSSREREILQLIIEGHTNNAVAIALNISIKTVEKHRASIMRKLDVHSFPELILFALKHRAVFLVE